MNTLNRVEELRRLKGTIISCRRCHLAETRTNAVPGEGPPSTALMFVGEAPGKSEDAQGKPFVGRAGTILDRLLKSINIVRDEVFIGNVLKCHPISPSGRDRRPNNEEISICSPYLDQQIEIIEPKVICTLGDTATRYILEKYGIKPRRISKLRGRIFDTGSLKIIPVFHPAAALYRRELEDTMRRDFHKLADLLKHVTRDLP